MDLFVALSRYRQPRDFIEGEPIYEVLRNVFHDDLWQARGIRPEVLAEHATLHILPDAAWSRRISGVFGNQLAQEHPARAHAVLVARSGGYLVSVRAPLARPFGADDLCANFESGGGRKGAAGINHLTQAELGRFMREFDKQFAV